MAKYIEREAAVSELNRIEKLYQNTYMSNVRAEMASYCCQVIKHIPAADVVEVRHAYWRDILPPDQDNNVQCWCSACGAGELHADGMIVPYCWKCGARMDGGVNDG